MIGIFQETYKGFKRLYIGGNVAAYIFLLWKKSVIAAGIP